MKENVYVCMYVLKHCVVPRTRYAQYQAVSILAWKVIDSRGLSPC